MNDNNFFSADRLVEFGLGMAVAQQMVNTMNQTMQSMYVPGSIQSMPQPQAKPEPIFYMAIDSKPAGPFNEHELAQLVINKQVTKDTLAWMPGMSTWLPVEQVPEVLKVIALTPPPLNI